MKKLFAAAPAILVSLYFLALAGRAVYTYFSPDDLMNLWQAWFPPGHVVLKANLLFFLPSPLPRPLASAWLRSIYSIAGFHPAPFKAINLAILVANIFLTYAVARRLANSRTAGALTALFAAYHGQAVQLYFDTGYIFDVLCYFFYLAAVLVYVRARYAGRFLTWRELAACCALYICSLNSKEMAVTLPAFLLLYELFYHSTFLGIGEWTIAVWRRWAGVIAIGAITAAVLAGRILHGSLIADSAYTPKISWPQFMKTSLDFTGNLFCHPHSFTPAMVVALWTAMLAIAWLLRSRALGFAWLFLMLSPLPIAFIDPRGIAQYYIPLFGWALYTGVLVNLGFDWVLNRVRPAISLRARIYSSAALIGVLALLLYPLWRSYDPDAPSSVTFEGEGNRSIVRQVHRLEPHLKPGATLMFLDDPVRANWYNLTFLMGLSYRDRRISVYRAKPGASESQQEREIPSSASLAAYDHVFDFRGGYFRELSPPWERIGAMPAVTLEYGRPQIWHLQDWSLVTRDRPAHPGEQVVVKAMDLGETVPRLSPGQTFPQEPLAEVVANVKVRVNGTPAATGTKVGWPGETNLYRLDLRIPENTPRGLSWIDLSTNGVRGPAIEFPVR